MTKIGDLPDGEFQAPALILDGVVPFPDMEVAITLADEKNKAAIDVALEQQHLVAYIPKSQQSNYEKTIGTLTLIRRKKTNDEGINWVLIKGLWRIQIERITDEKAYLKASFKRVGEIENDGAAKPKVMHDVLKQIDEFVKLIPGIPPEIIDLLKKADTPGKLADLCAYSPNFNLEERLDLLRTIDTEERLRKVNGLFEKQLASLRSAAEIITIPECDTCQELADDAFDSDASRRGEIAVKFLNHIAQNHTGELLALLAEKYGPTFLRKRALR
ncbi:MAG: LON peptidase substrate-binding domain-containing protein [Thaumarchaeota archaeon]|nr:LON peptidase substrate-binding domain-containing protein [Nitrososphaerota archaeon]